MISHTILQGIKNTLIMNKETQVFLYDKLNTRSTSVKIPKVNFIDFYNYNDYIII